METNASETNTSLGTLSRQLTEAVEGVSPSIVAVDARPRVPTSGIMWRPNVVVSTNHTVRRDEEITVTLQDGQHIMATLAGRDPGTDLCVLRIEGDHAGAAKPPARFADASILKVGQLVLAVGRTDPERGVSAGLGIIGVLGQKWRTWRGGEIDQLIRPDISIFLGFSGGALVNTEGTVIGINTTGLARGAGLTIPASTVDRVIDQLLAHGRITRPYLGIGMQPVVLPEKLREKFHWPTASALVMLSVEPDSPADKAGIILGDILLALDDAPTANTDDVQAILGDKQVGVVVKSRILRGGEIIDGEITLGERPTRKR